MKLLSRRFSAVIMTAALLFVSAFSVCVSVNAATTYTPRLTAPDYSNKYYYSDINLFHKYGYGLPNCTAYAYGRAYENLGTAPNLCPYSAGEWYSYNKNGGYYPYGQTPKLGAIACWNYGSGGHVAVVEQINSDGSMTLSNSEWGGRSFYLTYANVKDSNPGGNSWWTFQGYIYVVNTDGADVTEPEEDDTANYETGVYITDVNGSSLNMRSGAGTNNSVVASIGDNVKLNVTKITKANGYTWGYTTYNGKSGWVALNFCEYAGVYTEPDPEPTTKPDKKIAEGDSGDINSDGYLNIIDASLVQKYVTGTSTLSRDQISRSDFNKDGKVTISDVTALQRYISE